MKGITKSTVIIKLSQFKFHLQFPTGTELGNYIMYSLNVVSGQVAKSRIFENSVCRTKIISKTIIKAILGEWMKIEYGLTAQIVTPPDSNSVQAQT
jgi:hypothetical protein